MEGTGNPAFNMSSPDLSAQQSSEKKVIRHDTRDRTLAAHQQKCRLQASAEPKGVTSALVIFTLGGSRCAPAVTWASWSSIRHSTPARLPRLPGRPWLQCGGAH